MGSYRNPILPGCHPDPSICRVGDEYYLVTSSFEYLPGLPLHRSRDLVHWELIGHAVHRPEQLDFRGVPSSRGLFAPTIRVHDGRFVVVCTVVREDDDRAPSGHFAVTASDPAGPWSDPIWIEGVTGIDPSLTVDGDQVWLCGTREAAEPMWEGQTEVWLVPLHPSTYQPIGPVDVIWRGAMAGAVWAEGPHIVRHPDGGWMLIAAEGGTDRDHAVVVAYADEITGPYRGDPGNPRLTHRHLGETVDIVNVGHADLVDAGDGRTWAVALATGARDGANGLQGRQTHLVPVTWEHGRPVFAPGAGRVLRATQAEGVPDQADAPTVVHDDFSGAELDLAWNGVRWHPQEFTDLRTRERGVTVRATPDEPTGVGRTAFLGRRLPADCADVRVVLGPVVDPLRAGILLRTAELGQLEVSADSTGTARLILTGELGRTTLGQTRVDPARPIEFVLRIRHRRAEAIVAGTELGPADLGDLATGRPGWFVGSWIGPFAVGEGAVDITDVEVTAVEDAAVQKEGTPA